MQRGVNISRLNVTSIKMLYLIMLLWLFVTAKVIVATGRLLFANVCLNNDAPMGPKGIMLLIGLITSRRKTVKFLQYQHFNQVLIWGLV